MQEEEKQADEMQWSSVNNRLICEPTAFNISYLNFMNVSFKCCYDRCKLNHLRRSMPKILLPFPYTARRRFCLDHRVPVENFARPCPRNEGELEEESDSEEDEDGYAASLCIRSNRRNVPSFLRNLELCMPGIASHSLLGAI